jgi:hypothetical protein
MGKKRTKAREAEQQPSSLQQQQRRYPTRKLTKTTHQPHDNDDNLNCAISLEELSAGSLILENILSFLDTPTLKACRLVCKNWDEAALRLLNKREYLNIYSFYKSHQVSQQEQFLPRASLHYSSWQLKQGSASTEFLRMYGAQVRSLWILGIDNGSRACMSWIRHLLSEWCPRVHKVHLHFRELPKNQNLRTKIHKLRWEESYAFGKSLKNERSLRKFQATLEVTKNHSFRPFPQLPNLTTISISVGCRRVDSLFTFNVICSCPNLKHLFLNGLDHWCSDVKESGFRILEYLSRRPDITTKLESFVWKVSMGHVPEEEYSRYGREARQLLELYPEEERQPVLLLTDSKKRAIQRMQFSDKLKYLHWDVLWVERNGQLGGLGLLPGTLDKTVARNLRKLSTRKAVMDPTSFPPIQAAGAHQEVRCLHIHYLLMPKLVELEIGLRTCYTISLSDLLDAAPNLKTLRITGCECHDVLNDDIWSGSDFISSSVRPHSSVKFFKAGVSMRSEEILQKTVRKFPNLEELWIGPQNKPRSSSRTNLLALESVSSILRDLRSLQRLKWNRESGSLVQFDDLIENLLAVGRLTTMERYELELNRSYDDDKEHVGLEGYWRRKEEFLGCIRNWPKDSKCRISVSWKDPWLFGWAGGKCLSDHPKRRNSVGCYGSIQSFFSFVEDEGLPIHFHNPEPPSARSIWRNRHQRGLIC